MEKNFFVERRKGLTFEGESEVAPNHLLNVTKARFSLSRCCTPTRRLFPQIYEYTPPGSPMVERHERRSAPFLPLSLSSPPLPPRIAVLGRFPLTFFSRGNHEGPRVTLRDTRITLRPYNTSRLTITSLNEPATWLNHEPRVKSWKVATRLSSSLKRRGSSSALVAISRESRLGEERKACKSIEKWLSWEKDFRFVALRYVTLRCILAFDRKWM